MTCLLGFSVASFILYQPCTQMYKRFLHPNVILFKSNGHFSNFLPTDYQTSCRRSWVMQQALKGTLGSSPCFRCAFVCTCTYIKGYIFGMCNTGQLLGDGRQHVELNRQLLYRVLQRLLEALYPDRCIGDIIDKLSKAQKA